MAELHPAPVQWANVATDSHGPFPVLDYTSHRGDQAVCVEDHIGISAQRVGVSGSVYTGVESIGAAPILLVDDGDAHRAPTPVDTSDRSGLDVGPIGDLHPLQVEGLDEPLECVVGGAIVGDHYFEPGISHDRHRADRFDDPSFLVVGRNHYRDRWRGLAGQHVGDAAETVHVMVPPHHTG